MTNAPLLGPIIALVAWTLVMLVWMAFTRMPAMKRAGIDVSKTVGGRGQNLEGVLPDQVNWKSHNYTHLHEQPTIFYAIVLALAYMEQNHQINVWLAWGYVIFAFSTPSSRRRSTRSGSAFPCLGCRPCACSG